jgi:transposase
MSWVPTGELFLPEHSIKELKILYKKEREPKAKLRLLSAILRKKEYSITDISKHTEVPRMTISDWLRRLHNGGFDNLYDKKQPGRPAKLGKKQLIELERIMEGSPQNQDLPYIIWTTKLVKEFIKEKYDVSYELRQTRNIVRKLGFSSQKPRPMHRKASKKSQEDFKKTSKKISDHMLKMDMRSSFWTKASSQ